MKTYASCGKGGVGKTFTACALALYFARTKKKTALIDFDGGHSAEQTLGVEAGALPNTTSEIEHNLSLTVVENADFISARGWKDTHPTFEGYFDQFPGDFGIIALADMVEGFFGVPTDVPTLQKFAVLVATLNALEAAEYEHVIIDVEPTAGLQRLLSNADATLRSLQNLKGQNKTLLKMMSLKWPDIVAYAESSYVQDIERYSRRVEHALRILREAHYMLVTTAKLVPVQQTYQVREIVERFGGRVRVCVLNDLRGDPGEAESIAALAPHDLPFGRISHHPDFESLPTEAKRHALMHMSAGFVMNVAALR